MKNIIITAVIVILVASASILGYFYADTSNELSSKKLQLNVANAQVTSLQSQLTTANSQVTSLQTQLNSANAQVASLQSQLNMANAQVTSLQTQLNTANTQVTSLQMQLDTANTQVASLQSQLNTANAQVASLQTQLATANAQIASLQSQLALAQSNTVTITRTTTTTVTDESQTIARHFNSQSELITWMNSLPSSLKNWDGNMGDALDRQQQAAEDGYIWSVCWTPDGYWEEAIAGNILYSIESDGSLVSLGTV